MPTSPPGLAHLVLRADGQPCTLAVGPQQVDEHTDGAYTVLPLHCHLPARRRHAGHALHAVRRHRPAAPRPAQLTANGGHPHRHPGPAGAAAGLRTAAEGAAGTSSSTTCATACGTSGSASTTSCSCCRCCCRRWAPGPGAGPARHGSRCRGCAWRCRDVLRIVTAFTVAHSITLSPGHAGLVSLPSRLVEAAIAASVVLAALNNVWPLFQGRRWMVAFGFGLIHGFGFASVLADLGLPQDALVLALLGFNAGRRGRAAGHRGGVPARGLCAAPGRVLPPRGAVGRVAGDRRDRRRLVRRAGGFSGAPPGR
jgi:hypothetical protein